MISNTNSIQNHKQQKMGYTKHHAIIVTGWGEKVIAAHATAEKLFNARGIDIVTQVMRSANGSETFFIAPDGSDDGRETSNIYDILRATFMGYLKNEKIDYVEICFGNEWRKENPALVAHVSKTNC